MMDYNPKCKKGQSGKNMVEGKKIGYSRLWDDRTSYSVSRENCVVEIILAP